MTNTTDGFGGAEFPGSSGADDSEGYCEADDIELFDSDEYAADLQAENRPDPTISHDDSDGADLMASADTNV